MDQQSKTLKRHDLLSNIFADQRFVPKGRYLYLIENDGAKIGIVVATLNPGFFEHALNKAAIERVLASLRNGKIDEGYVVFARVDNSRQHTFMGCREIEELYQQMMSMGLRPRSGIYGEFYTLPTTLTATDDEPL
jgi:hypothetical protein